MPNFAANFIMLAKFRYAIRHRILPVNFAGKISRGFRGSEFRAEFCSSKFLAKIPPRNFEVILWRQQNFCVEFCSASFYTKF